MAQHDPVSERKLQAPCCSDEINLYIRGVENELLNVSNFEFELELGHHFGLESTSVHSWDGTYSTLI